MADDKFDDGIQHGIDDDPSNDPQKGAVLGGVGGAAVGAAAGSMMGPVGAVIGGVVGAAAGALGSAAGVAAVDRMDNDDTISGVGDGVTYEDHRDFDDEDTYAAAPMGTTATNAYNTTSVYPTPPSQYGPTTGSDLAAGTDAMGNGIPGVQTGGTAYDGTPDTRGMTEKAADAITGDRIDDKTGKPVY